MATYTITAVSPNVRDWTASQGGAMKEYRVHLRDGQDKLVQNVEWSRKASSPAPTVGQQIEGELQDKGQYGFKLKVAPGGRGGGYGPRPEDPKRAATITRQHSQGMALQYFALAGKVPSREQIAELCDWFDQDVRAAGERAS